jgi:hypothetical protein
MIRSIQRVGLALLLVCSSAAAQDNSKTEKALYLIGASAAFSTIDYFGYNLTKNEQGVAPVTYRVFQVLVQAGLTYFLYEKCGLPTSIAFNLIWWTFGNDFTYYGISELVPAGGQFEGRGTWGSFARSGGPGHAYWTPVGLLRGFQRGEKIPADTMIAQSIIGAVIGMSITIWL